MADFSLQMHFLQWKSLIFNKKKLKSLFPLVAESKFFYVEQRHINDVSDLFVDSIVTWKMV